MSDFVVGQAYTLDYSLTLDDEPIDASIALTVNAPDGTTRHPVVVHPATGQWTVSDAADQAGIWRFRWAASGAAIDASEGAFTVAASSLDPGAPPAGFVTLDKLKRDLNIEEHDDDDELTFFLAAATTWVAKRVQDISPEPVQLAILNLVNHLWETQRGPAAGPLDEDTLNRPGLGYAIPNRVAQLLGPYVGGATPRGSFPPPTPEPCW